MLIPIQDDLPESLVRRSEGVRTTAKRRFTNFKLLLNKILWNKVEQLKVKEAAGIGYASTRQKVLGRLTKL